MGTVNSIKTIYKVLFFLLISNILVSEELDIDNALKVKEFIESFNNGENDFCYRASDALKASLYARRANLVETSSRILERLIRCDAKREIYYKELIETFSVSGQETEALNLLRFSKKNLEKKAFKSLERKFNRSFMKSYALHSFNLTPSISNNYNSGLNTDYIFIYDFPFSVDQDSKPKTGIGLKSSYGMKLFLPNKKMEWDSLELNILSSDYPERVGDILYSSITHHKKFANTSLINNIFNLRVGSKKYLESWMLGFEQKISSDKNKKLWLSFKIDKYINEFQEGKGLKFGYFGSGIYFNDFFFERYLANSDSYSFKSVGFNTKKFTLFKSLGLDIKLNKNIYDEEFAVFQTTRKGRNFQINLFTKIQNYSFKLSFNRQKSNIAIFDNRSINLEIYL